MNFKHLLFAVVACTLAVAGCKKPEPIVEPDSITVDPSALTFDGKAGSAQVTVTANTSWSTSGAPAWVTVTPASGSNGTAKVTVSVEAGAEQARNASLVFTAGKASKTITVNQSAGEAPAVPTLTGEVTQVDLLADQTEATFKIKASNLKGKWTVTPKATYDWVSDFTKEGTTSGDIVVKVTANKSENDRTAEFTVAAEGASNVALTLVQKGAKIVTDVAGVAAQITSADQSKPSNFVANLAGAVVSYVNGKNAYIEDASGAILLYMDNNPLIAGQKISGPVSGTGYLYNGLPEITSVGTEVKIEDGGTIPETTMTIADLLKNYQKNLSRRIKLVGVTVKDAIANGDRNGVITQGSDEINVYAGLNNKGLVMAAGDKGDLICYPTLYNDTKQVSFWDNADFTSTAISITTQNSRVEIDADVTEAKFSIVAKNLKKSWTVTPKETYDWVTEYTKDGLTSGDIVVKVSANPGATRTAEFTVASEGATPLVLTLVQKGNSQVTNIAGIASLITSTSSSSPSSYKANLTEPAVVSYVNGDNVYIEDNSGAILLYMKGHGLAPGVTLSGIMEGSGYLYNGLPEITAIGGDVVKGTGGEIPLTTLTIAELVANYKANLSRRIKLVDVKVKDGIGDGDRNGVISQNGAEINVYAGLNNKGLLIETGTKGNLICYPTLYKDAKQVSFWDNADWTKTAEPSTETAIKTADEFLAWMANPTAEAVLEADINLTGKNFTPGTISSTLDGQGHKVTYELSYAGSDKTADNPTIADWGLFRKASGTIKNLKVAGKITFEPVAGTGTYHVGGVVGTLEGSGVLDNCQSEVDIIATTQVTHHMGGLAGYTAFGAKVQNCVNKGKVEMIIPNKGAANASQLGGIIGHIEGKGTVENCTNEGQVTYEGTGTPRVAGICGYVNNASVVSFVKCTNNGKILINEGNYSKTSWSYVGGVTGYYGTPTTGASVLYDGCVNNGKIEINVTEEKTKMRVGGVVSHGGISGGDEGIMTWTVRNCTNNGEIVCTSTTANNFLGGIIGYTEVSCHIKCDGCTNNGKITSYGKGCVGGILGRNCFVGSSFTNMTVGEKTVLETKDAAGNIGLLIGYAPALTTGMSGKVAGTIIKGSDTITITADNYANYLYTQELGEGGNTIAVKYGK